MDGEPDDSSEEVARAIGLVAVAAARVEQRAATLAVLLIGTPQAVPVVVGRLWSQNYETIKILIQEERKNVPQLEPEIRTDVTLVLDNLLATLTQANSLISDRNNVVHALWTVSSGSGTHIAETMKYHGKRNIKAWTLADLDRLQADLLSTDAELAEANDYFG